ncbi:MAG: hypothetical protein KME05_02285 [Gloeocapsa sp. UFS-A4-WI-NPMV-4B04]|jgi:hypothetical protein|nr:hypothetical protein [Gloeocapsa sp. UFS-A4-WI-NPMV-4B04]
MIKPLGYYASAPSGTKDAEILSDIENSYGCWLEKLSNAQKSTLLIVLMALAIKPEGVYVEYYGDNIPNIKHFSDLSNGAKLSLCNAIINAIKSEGKE